MYIAQFLARCGLCSRRKSVMLVKEGKVLVNGVALLDPMYKIKDDDIVSVDGKIISKEQYNYILLNKPEGYLSTCLDEQDRKTVMDLIPKEFGRLYPIGRLDKMTTGLLLLTNDGDLSQRLAHPKFKIVKKYRVELDQDVKLKDFSRLLDGVELEDGFMKVDRISYAQNRKDSVNLEIHSGKKRVIRRLFTKLWYKVQTLDRYYYAGLDKSGIKLGEWRELSEQEEKTLKGDDNF